ncbi:hypothetical protein [Streptomyces thermolilacinus]|uniref:hypothetical protein n=1 Tax=Streptomyces thermolilacinus TaxID=285540 RepID=UPI0033EA7D5C
MTDQTLDGTRGSAGYPVGLPRWCAALRSTDQRERGAPAALACRFAALVRDAEANEPEKTFADSSVGGSTKAITNIAFLLALRDLGRIDPAVCVPPLLVIDSPLNGLGAQGIDRETGRRLIDTLISIAEDPAADGYGVRSSPPPTTPSHTPIRPYGRSTSATPTASSTTHPATTPDPSGDSLPQGAHPRGMEHCRG